MTWRIPVTWSMCAVIPIEADTLEEAMEIARDENGEIPLPPATESDYLDGSWCLSHDDTEIVRQCYNGGRKDPAFTNTALKKEETVL